MSEFEQTGGGAVVSEEEGGAGRRSANGEPIGYSAAIDAVAALLALGGASQSQADFHKLLNELRVLEGANACLRPPTTFATNREALVYAGRKDEAQKQFARAAALDLTPYEKFELAEIGHV